MSNFRPVLRCNREAVSTTRMPAPRAKRAIRQGRGRGTGLRSLDPQAASRTRNCPTERSHLMPTESHSDAIIRVARIEMRISRQASSLFLVRGFVQGFNSAPLSVIGLVEIEQNRADKPFLRSAVRSLP